MSARRLASCKRQSNYSIQDQASRRAAVLCVTARAWALLGAYPILYAPPVGTPTASRHAGNSTPELEFVGGFQKHVNRAIALNPLNRLRGVN